jgi:hypothetical protein
VNDTPSANAAALELQLTSPATSDATSHRLTGAVRGAAPALQDGASVLVAALSNGLVEEAYLDESADFALDVELLPDTDNHYLVGLCDATGREVLRLTTTVRHGSPLEVGVAMPPQALEPPWRDFARRVKECLYLAGKVGDATGRSPQELFEQVYAQERYAEEAFAATNSGPYRECFDNLGRLADYLRQLCRDHLPGGRP